MMCWNDEGIVSIYDHIGSKSILTLLSKIFNRETCYLSSLSDSICRICFKTMKQIEELQNKIIDIMENINYKFKNGLSENNVEEFKNGLQNESIITVNKDTVDILPVENIDVISTIIDKKNKQKEVKRKYNCTVCNKSFRAYSHRTEHMLIHTKERNHPCDTCNFRARTKSVLKKHKMKHLKDKGYKCGICKIEFKTNTELITHSSSHPNSKVFKCKECDKDFGREPDRRVHMMSIHKIGIKELYKCHICNKEFVLKTRLSRHLLTHDSIKKFECQVCDRRFSRKDDLVSHGRIHSGSKPYHCQKCNKSFRFSSNYHLHCRSHTNLNEDLQQTIEVSEGSLTEVKSLSHEKDEVSKCEDYDNTLFSEGDLMMHKITSDDSDFIGNISSILPSSKTIVIPTFELDTWDDLDQLKDM